LFEKIELVAVDLMDPASIEAAVEGVDFVVHTASPFPNALPANLDDLYKPAVEGTLTVLKAAQKHGVKRVVITSSVAAMIN